MQYTSACSPLPQPPEVRHHEQGERDCHRKGTDGREPYAPPRGRSAARGAARGAGQQRRCLLAAAPGPCDQEKHLPVAVRDPYECGGEPAAERFGGEAHGDALGVAVDRLARAGPRERAVSAYLSAVMAGDEVRGDPVQPRPRIWVRHLVALPAVEGDQECLRCDVVGEARGAKSARHVSVDRDVVAVEDLREPLGLAAGPLDQLGVCAGSTTSPARVRRARVRQRV